MLDKNKQMARRSLDKRLTPLRAAINSFTAREGWIRTVRTALGMSGPAMASRMGVTKQWLNRLEQGERSGSATIASLTRAAEALECRFVYAFIPYNSLEEMVEVRAREIANREVKRVDQTMALEDQQVSRKELERRVAEYIRDHIRDADLWRDD